MSKQSSIIKTALLSVSDKRNIVSFAEQLHKLNIRLLSTGGTATLLEKQHIPVTRIAHYTQFPEIMNGRVKTLHPKIYAGLLARSGIDEDLLEQHEMDFIDLVVVNLYPFETVIREPDCDFSKAIEHIDIGGPTLLRASAKNHERVTVIVDPKDYDRVLSELKDEAKNTCYETRLDLAKKVFQHTATYDAAILNYLTQNQTGMASESTDTVKTSSDWPDTYSISLTKKSGLRYGENPHQSAAFYKIDGASSNSIVTAKQWQGKSLSFNNIVDAEAALGCVQQFLEPACVIVKHGNPCGVAVGLDLISAYKRAFLTDSTSAFGGIIACNVTVDSAEAQVFIESQFVEVIVAPEVTPAALDVLGQKPNVRVLSVGFDKREDGESWLHYQSVRGGILIQEPDHVLDEESRFETVTQRQPTDAEWRDLCFAWKVAKFVRSNAIVLANDQATVGIGAGQMSRIDSAKIAVRKANDANLLTQQNHVVLASDAFFPFPDIVELVSEIGVKAIIQPGGSIRDVEVIAEAELLGIAMVLTHTRHFLH